MVHSKYILLTMDPVRTGGNTNKQIKERGRERERERERERVLLAVQQGKWHHRLSNKPMSTGSIFLVLYVCLVCLPDVL